MIFINPTINEPLKHYGSAHKSIVIAYITRLTTGRKAEYNNFRQRVKWLRSKVIKQHSISDTKIKFSYNQSPGLCKVIIQGEKLANENWIGQLKDRLNSEWENDTESVKEGIFASFNEVIQNILGQISYNQGGRIYIIIHWGCDDYRTPTLRLMELSVSAGNHNFEYFTFSTQLDSEYKKLLKLFYLSPSLPLDEMNKLLEEFRIHNHHLQALSMLCQGYLAVFAASTDYKKINKTDKKIIDQALKSMGWNDDKTGKFDINISEIINNDLGNKYSNVRENKWWKATFDGLDDSLNNMLEKEWDLNNESKWKDMEVFLKNIDNNSSVIEPLDVAEVYITLINYM